MANTDIRHAQTLRQEQTMSARQLQSLSLLHTPRQELRQVVEQMLAENPVLEITSPPAEIPAGDPLSQPDPDDDDYTNETSGDDDDWVNRVISDADDWHDSPGDLPDIDRQRGRDYLFQSLSEEESAQQQWLDELAMTEAPPRIRTIAEMVIGSLDENGYLRTPAADLAMAADADMDEVFQAIRLVQSFDPPGIAAATPAECLRLQLERQGETDPVLYELIDHHLETIAANRLPALARQLGLTVDELNTRIDRIRQLNPFPAAGMNHTPPVYVTPEVEIIRDADGNWQLAPGQSDIRLHIPEHYLRMAADKTLSAEDHEYLRAKLESARNLIQALAMRDTTIRRIAAVIAAEQQAFFSTGVEALKPLTLRRVAEQLDLHETTVSRAIANKYLQTPQGLLPFKYFFSSGYHNEDGESLSSRSVMERIRKMIAAEDPADPLSDDRIAELLNRDGCDVARRTVAKYREKLGIPSTRKRRHYSN
ncbi:MAG: RNA polymerase factor sigma-54 [Lentisphaeria bacterium]|nr:RNA polymerase factor sigma-54 [Lentisphaeria bacterium]